MSGSNSETYPHSDGLIRVMVVDDHPVVRYGLVAIIQRAGDMKVVAEASSGDEAVNFCRAAKPDVVLMDLRMPGMDGVAAITALKDECPRVRTIIVTTFDGDEDIYRGIRAGAKGYLLKDAPREELLDAIRAVYAGQTRIPPEIAAKLADRVHRPELTLREKEVLELIAAGKSNQEIGAQLFITEGTVKAHVNSILTKMHVKDRTQAATQAIERGLVHRPWSEGASVRG
jgi:two-component system, NarL family, response regulator